MRQLLLISLLVFTSTNAGIASAQAGDAEVDSVAGRALSQFVGAWTAAAGGDVKGYEQYRALYWPDADLVDPTGAVWNGQDGIVQMHAAAGWWLTAQRARGRSANATVGVFRGCRTV